MALLVLMGVKHLKILGRDALTESNTLADGEYAILKLNIESLIGI